MKKIFLGIAAIIALNSCSSDDNPNQPTEKELIKVVKNFQNTGNKSTLFFENGKLTHSTYNDNTTMEELEYNDDKMVRYTNFEDNGTDIEYEYQFNYDSNGNLTSYHVHNSNPLFTSQPEDQDVTLNWNGNVLTFSEIVDNDTNATKTFEYTFNNDNKLTHIKCTNNENVDFNFEFTLNNDGDIVNMNGFTDVFGVYNQNVDFVYDDKTNPYYPFYNKYYLPIIISSSRTGFFGNYNIFAYLDGFGKHNFVENNNVNGQDDPNEAYYEYTYDGDYPTQANYRNSSSIATVIDFTYN